MRKTGKLAEKIFYNQRYKEWTTTTRRITTDDLSVQLTDRLLLQSQRSKKPELSPKSGVLQQNDDLKNVWLRKPAELTFRKVRGLYKIETPLLNP